MGTWEQAMHDGRIAMDEWLQAEMTTLLEGEICQTSEQAESGEMGDSGQERSSR
jgi:hypothetical protein